MKEIFKKHCEKYDAYFDTFNGKWQERTCPDKECNYCNKRPAKHLNHKYEDYDGKIKICK